jgi:hypothetical protein
MAGEIDANNENELSGWLRISPDKDQDNLEEWRSKAEALCRHIRHLMSFGAGVSLSCPIVEFQQDRLVYIDAYPKSQQQPSAFPVFPPMHLDDFFQCVVNSYFDPAVHVEKLTYATQWFTMRSVYRELYLISSMTVLENLIGSNLSEADTLILSKKDFERLRKGLSGVVKEQATDLFDDPEMQKNFIHNLNEGIAGLKRKSLFEKITLLASQWGVDLNDIPKEKIEAAKAARDHVVHRGHYEPKSSSTEDLLDHILTVREIVVRFILTALNFNGRYQSYIYGGDLRKLTKALPATRN